MGNSSGLLDLAGDLDQTAEQIAGAVQPFLRRLPIGVIDEPVVGLQLDARALLANEGDEALRIGKTLVAEGDDGALRPGIDLLDASLPAQRLDLHHVE